MSPIALVDIVLPFPARVVVPFESLTLIIPSEEPVLLVVAPVSRMNKLVSSIFSLDAAI